MLAGGRASWTSSPASAPRWRQTPPPKHFERCAMVNGERYIATSLRHQSRRRYDGFRVPALVLLAGATFFEGYAQLGAIGSPVYLRGSVGVGLFAGTSLIVITLVDGTAGGRHHQTSVRSLVAARALLVTATFVVFVLPRAVGSRTLGASDLLVALGVLLSAVLDERRAFCPPSMLDHLSRLSLSPEDHPPL